MACPTDRRYLDTHEWHRPEDGDIVTLGLTRYAVDELTDVTYVELPEVGTEFAAGDSIGEIESVKATSEIYTGVGGKVVEVNEAVQEDPAVVNQDPYDGGWLMKLEMSDASELETLMDSEAYEKKYPSGE